MPSGRSGRLYYIFFPIFTQARIRDSVNFDTIAHRGDSMSAVKTAVVARFQYLCAQRGCSINTLATESGVTPSTVYSLFNSSRKTVTIDTIKILCDGLGVTLGEFFSAPELDNLDQEIR